MTAQDKAMQLVDTYRDMLMNTDTDCGEEILCTVIAKKCALNTVEEILQQFESIKVSHIISGYVSYKDFEENLTSIQNQLDSEMISKWNYWNEVKHEIEQL